jgi:hypothetical protein
MTGKYTATTDCAAITQRARIVQRHGQPLEKRNEMAATTPTSTMRRVTWNKSNGVGGIVYKAAIQVVCVDGTSTICLWNADTWHVESYEVPATVLHPRIWESYIDELIPMPA